MPGVLEGPGLSQSPLLTNTGGTATHGHVPVQKRRFNAVGLASPGAGSEESFRNKGTK